MTETKSVCFNKPYLAVQKLMCVPSLFEKLVSFSHVVRNFIEK